MSTLLWQLAQTLTIAVETDDSYPRRFGKYVLIAPLARGGMGELHLAVSGRSDLAKVCVIKTILGHLANDEYVQRFADEATLMVRLSHGNLVPVFEAGTLEGQYYLAMEFIDGRDLRTVFRAMQDRCRAFPLDVALYITKQICRGLQYAHTFQDLQLVHRDVSPPNVLLSYSGEIKVTDFGLAFSTIKLQKTAPGVLFGKLSYMAPEQARNETVDQRTDTYATGVIFWELITGRRLLSSEGSQLERLRRAANPSVTPPSKVNPSLPPALDLIALRALAPRKEDRYQSIEAMRKDIAGFLAKVDPTTDSLAVQRLLRELYGREIERERQDRAELLERMAIPIQRLLEGPKTIISDATETAEGNDDFGSERTASDPHHSHALHEGTVLADRYRIDARLREGGMGTVYLATHTEIERQVAVKVLNPIFTRMPDVVSRFRREAKAATRIGHPNIVEVYDSGSTQDGAVYFVMEHLEGQDLGEVLRDVGQLNIQRALRIARQVSLALAAAHDVGIVHRDLKPENILLTPREGSADFVKVVDFGIAQMAHAEGSSQEPLTNPGMPIGTPQYMSPEQARGHACDHRADIYALGVILYEMLAGHPPHEGDNVVELLERKASGQITSLLDLRPEIAAELDELTFRMLRRDPNDRPQSMSQVSYDLTKLTSGRAGAVATVLGLSQPGVEMPATGTSFPRVNLPSDSRRRLWPILLAAGVAIGALSTLLLPGKPRPARESATPTAATAPPVDARGGRDADVPAVMDATPHDSMAADQSGTDTDLSPRPRPNPTRRSRPLRARPGLRALHAGYRQLRRAKFAQAQRAFKAALKVRRLRGKALTGLAELEFQRGNFAKARVLASRARTAGGGLKAQMVLGNSYFKLRQFSRAMRVYRQVLRAHPRHREALRNLKAAKRRQSAIDPRR